MITTTDAIRILFSNNVQLQTYTLFSDAGAKVASGSESTISSSFLPSSIYNLDLSLMREFAQKR